MNLMWFTWAALSRVDCISQLGVICKLAESALDSTVGVVDEDASSLPYLPE